MIRAYKQQVTATGATGSEQTKPVCGRVVAIHLDYSASAAATLDVTVSALAPAQTLLSISNNATDGWYYPRVAVQDINGADVTYDGTNEIYECVPVDDHLVIDVAGANDGDSVTVTILVEA